MSFTQILELVEFIAKGHPEDERPAFIASFKDDLKVEEGKTLSDEDDSRRKATLLRLLNKINQLGEGSDKGAGESNTRR